MRYYRQRTPEIKPHDSVIETLDHMVKVVALLEQYTPEDVTTTKRAREVAAIFLKRIQEVQNRSALGSDYVSAAWENLRHDAETLAKAEGRKYSGAGMALLVAQLACVRERVREAGVATPEAALENTITIALQLEAPAIEAEFIDEHRASFARLSALNDWKGVTRGKHGEWARHEASALMRVCEYEYTHEGQNVVFSEELAAKAAREYATAIVVEMAYKMSRKLGALTQVEIRSLRPGARELTLTGRRGEDRILVTQQRVSHYNQNGTYYQQYPALIYVNGVRVSEAEYKARQNIIRLLGRGSAHP